MAYKVGHAVDLDSDIVVSATVHPGNAADTATVIDTAIDAAVNAEQAGAEKDVQAIVADKGHNSLKVEGDRQRVAGRFLLTGSTNVLLMPQVADSLAGRVGSIRLHPMAQCEIQRRKPRLLHALMHGDIKIRSSPRLAG